MSIELRSAMRTDVGKVRDHNEDAAYVGMRVLAVADGMGGHEGGEVASKIAITAVASLDEEPFDDEDVLETLRGAIREATLRLRDRAREEPDLVRMGTTLTALAWSGTKIGLAHVGDSRAYLLRGGDLYQITRDHTLVQRLVDDGRITAEQAATHPRRSVLMRVLGCGDEADPDLDLREAVAGDRYLLCSDGLSGVVEPERLLDALTSIDDPDEVVDKLVDLANRAGGPDNITCVVADVVEAG